MSQEERVESRMGVSDRASLVWRLSPILLASTAFGFAGSGAMAQCVPDPPTSGATVTCSGNPNNFEASNLAALTVDVVSGTNINGPFGAERIDVLDVTNRGNVNGPTSFANDGQLTFLHFGALNNGLSISSSDIVAVTNGPGGRSTTISRSPTAAASPSSTNRCSIPASASLDRART